MHKTRELSAGFVAPVVNGAPDRPAAAKWAVVWSPKEPLPAFTRHASVPIVPRPAAAKTGLRRL